MGVYLDMVEAGRGHHKNYHSDLFPVPFSSSGIFIENVEE